jgi:hypothetical protein
MVRVAPMHMEGGVARWFQSVERKVRQIPWSEFCALVHDRFSRDQHEALICQLFHIRQTSTVTKYVESFSMLVDQLAAYEAEANPLYYAMRIVDGLKEDVKSVVMIQHSATLDATCALALVQEKAMDSRRKKSFGRHESSSSRMPYRSGTSYSSLPKFDKYVEEPK